MTQLRYLSLASNETITGASLRCLTNLEGLDLSKNNAIQGKDLANLRKIKYLNLNCSYHTRGAHISHLPLVSLSLEYNTTIRDRCLSKLTTLTELDIRENDTITRNGFIHLPNLVLIHAYETYSIGARDVDPQNVMTTDDGRKISIKWGLPPRCSWYPGSGY